MGIYLVDRGLHFSQVNAAIIELLLFDSICRPRQSAQERLVIEGHCVMNSVNAMQCRNYTTQICELCGRVSSKICIEAIGTVKQKMIALSEIYVHSNIGILSDFISFKCVYCVVDL